MESTLRIPEHQYENLRDPRTHIRLLQICSINESREVPVHCKLTEWTIDAAPDYTAISYTWGDPSLIEIILVDDKRMEVRQNCAYVFRQAWQLKGSGYIWIDAVCINQIDNNEKSHQVAMMGSVYQKAVQTLACVGRHENDSEFLFDMLHKKSHWWSQQAYDTLFLRFRRAHLWGVLLRNSTKARLLKAFNLFLGRQYFRRVWIYQELFFGRDVRVCCADRNVQISMLFQLKVALDAWVFHPHTLLRRSRTYLEQYHGHELRAELLLNASSMSQDKESLSHTMLLVSMLQCEEPRDRVYGILAVVDWEGLQPIEPDYNRDRFALALDVLQRIYHEQTFSGWFFQVCRVGENLHLVEEPSDGLDDAIRERRLLTYSDNTITNLCGPEKVHSQEMIKFWGIRLLLDDATREFSLDTSMPAVGLPNLGRTEAPASYTSSKRVFPSIKKWSKENPSDWAQVDILLPQDAQRQDWILVPSTDLYQEDKFFTDDAIMAFMAREGGDQLLHLVDKVLVFPQRLWPRVGGWKKFWERDIGSAKYGVHIAPEDGLSLACSVNWEKPQLRHVDIRESIQQLAGKYFETKLWGSKSCSYAIPMDF